MQLTLESSPIVTSKGKLGCIAKQIFFPPKFYVAIS